MLNLLYLHGFKSSPQSHKAQLTRNYFKKHHPEIKFHCPQLASSPIKAIEQIEDILSKQPNENWVLMGSSLGGYFSTYFAEKYRLKAALINPAVKPFVLLKDYMGKHENPYTNEQFTVESHHIEQLQQLDQKIIQKKLYLVMVQTGDEVLNYLEAVEKYDGCQFITQQGGDHSFVDFDKMLPSIAKFLI